MDLSFLIIMLSMFLVAEKKDAQFRKKKEETLRTLLPYALLYTTPCLQNQKSKKKESSPHICYLSHTVDFSFLTQHNSLPDSIVSHYYL